MEKGRVVDPELSSQHGVVLVTGGAYGVEAAVGLLQLPSRHVEGAAGDLVLPQLNGLAGRQGGARSQGIVRCQQCCRRSGLFEELVESALDDCDAVEGHRAEAMIDGGR